MQVIKTKIKDCSIIKIKKNFDNRGSFERLFCNKKINFKLKQINLSSNYSKGTLRGFHYQRLPSLENKIICCVHGSIYNVIIDMRSKSKTFKKMFTFKLTQKDNVLIKIPAGCANCYLTLSDKTKILYFMEDYYKKTKNFGFHYKSIVKNIKWPISIKVISKSDNSLPKIDLS